MFIGGVLANVISPTIQLWLFVVFLALAGARMIYTCLEKSADEGACPILHYLFPNRCARAP